MKIRTLTLATAAVLAISYGAFAQPVPADNVSGRLHPNLAAAQRLCTQAYEKLSASQRANEFDEGGHAARAKELLDQANQEIKAAAMADNSHGRP